MKQLSFEPLRNWFGYTRRERRASTILIIIILIIVFIKLIFPDRGFPVEEVTMDIPQRISGLSGPGGETGRQPYRPGQASARQIKPRIELNTCDSAALESLPGIGPVLSARIVKYRNLLGGFATVLQLREVYGLPEETFKLIEPRVTADSGLIRKININSADFKKLSRLPYFEKYEIDAILKYRDIKGRISNLTELTVNKLITGEKFRKVRPYLETFTK